jgi:hypothetical protein
MYGSGRCSVISFIFILSVGSIEYAEVVWFLYVLMLIYKYDSNMNIQRFISFCLPVFGCCVTFM